MNVNGGPVAKAESHPYKGSALTRPDWPTKHDIDSKARNLLPYILEPAKHPDRVVRDTPDAVTIQDKYPKGQVHLLVLPKWQPHRDLHPHDAFEDPDFLVMMRAQAEEALKIAIPMLKEKVFDALQASGMDQKRAESVVEKRTFAKDFQIGIHAHPSQHELHVHVISRDMVSWHPYGSRHYQAFNTPFLVPLKLYPLALDDPRREVNYQNANLMKDDFECWRCGKNIGSDWDHMRKHLDKEFQGWIREGGDS
ncbi:aprataxin-like protein [Knufia obscura]|uniref:Aprataxin-like protein n=2 Tax=Knufia TaxID=430999 RepID=A0AAN8EX42_9EURO|nr:aprataxin-like protein [Knufia obscura]KAK5958125.1 aprataxin-like protein [Knufia fluminis]